MRAVARWCSTHRRIVVAGRAVVLVGMTVCIALLGMFALRVSFLYGVAIAASLVVALLVFTILFGLSVDYEVFLVSRIYEEHQVRKDTRAAIVHGLAATGRTITAAAAIMVLVFAAFVLGGERLIKLFGIGLASAVLLDALVIRSVLVRCPMLTFGNVNWYAPRWLDRVLPRLNVEGLRSAGPPPPPPRADHGVPGGTLGAAPAEGTTR
jgi:putative drug exporter of the RND superfamily